MAKCWFGLVHLSMPAEKNIEKSVTIQFFEVFWILLYELTILNQIELRLKLNSTSFGTIYENRK